MLLATGFLLAAARFGRQVPWKELFHPERRIRQVIVLAIAVLVVLPLAVGHSRGVGITPREQVRNLAPTPAAWISPPVAAAFDPELGVVTDQRVVGEWHLTPGLVGLVALAAGLMFAIRPGPFGGTQSAVAVAAWSVVLLALLVTLIGEFWLYAPFTYL